MERRSRRAAAPALLLLLAGAAAASAAPLPRRAPLAADFPPFVGAALEVLNPPGGGSSGGGDAAAGAAAAPRATTVKVMTDPASAAASSLSTKQLRKQFLVQDIFVPGQLTLTYTTIDRMVVGGATPLPGAPVTLANSTGAGVQRGPVLAAREMGVFNLGPAPARITVDGEAYRLAANETVYVPAGTSQVVFETLDPAAPAKLFLVSTPCGVRTGTVKVGLDNPVKRVPAGSPSGADVRTLYRLLGPAKVPSCQLTLGITYVHPGSVWNQQPAHLHERRSEVYLYFNMPPEARVFHMLGERTETRHVVVANEEAVLAPPWSLHFGVGTTSYSMLWAMAGENQDFDDRVPVELADVL